MTVVAVSTVFALVVAILSYVCLHNRRKSAIPRIGPKPRILGNTSRSYFYHHSLQLIEEGYAKYKHGLYSLWTTDMDRVIVSSKFMPDFMSLPRSTVRLTASIRHAGPWTGIDIAEESGLQFDVCAGQLTQNIGGFAQPVLDEIMFALEKNLKGTETANEIVSVSLFPLMIELVTSATARAFVGPELCRDKEWLQTATGYTMDVAKLTTDLNAYYRILHPIVAPFLPSYHRIRSRFSLARQLLLPLIEERRNTTNKEHSDMVQWLIESAKGKDAQTDKLVKRMLFLNMAAIHTTAEVVTIVLFELCERPEYIDVLQDEIFAVTSKVSVLALGDLNKLNRTDSFIKESHRLNPLGLMTFNRYLADAVKLHNGTSLPRGTYISMAHYPQQRDPELYPDPLKFDGLRFFNLRQNAEEAKKHQHQFASISSMEPWWGVGKFACPGRFWASAQIKLLLIALLSNFDISFPEGRSEKPERSAEGGKLKTSFTQQVMLRHR